MSFFPSPDPRPGDAASCDAVETLIIPGARELGGLPIRRALPSARRRLVGPFIFFDRMGPALLRAGEALDIRPHPHIGLSTVTYLFDGSIRHRDSLGSQMVIRPGDVNMMTAGRGIVHSERTNDERRRTGQRLFGIQTWVALPEGQVESDPGFVHHGAEALPVIEEGGMTARLIAGQAFGKRSPLATASETLYADVQHAPGASFTVEPSVTERALYTISGKVEVAGQSFAPAQLLVLRPGDQIVVRALTTARVMLFGGEPMEGPRWIWWNFVSSRKERIEQAQEEWRRGRFDTVPGDEAEFIPLPETNTKPRRAIGGVFYP